MIVRGKTIIGPLAVPPFTSPAARIESDDANDLCDNSLQFSTNVCISVFLCRMSTSEEYLQNLFASSNVDQNTDKRYRRPKVSSFASSDHVTLREQLLRVAAEPGFHIFTMLQTANHVRVTSTDMPYHGANFHGRGLKIRLCGLTVSTGALNAVEIYAKKEKNSFGRF